MIHLQSTYHGPIRQQAHHCWSFNLVVQGMLPWEF
jgi:hypothetical protein